MKLLQVLEHAQDSQFFLQSIPHEMAVSKLEQKSCKSYPGKDLRTSWFYYQSS